MSEICFWKTHNPYTNEQVYSLEELMLEKGLSIQQRNCKVCSGEQEAMENCTKAIPVEITPIEEETS